MWPAAAIPSALAWNCTATLLRGAYSSGASTRIVSAGASAMSPRSRRTPISTAMTAVPSVAASSSTRAERNRDPQRAHRLATVVLAGLGETIGLDRAPVEMRAAS